MIPGSLKLVVSPADAYYGHKKSVPFEESVGKTSGEMIMAYPPGIPVICLGEEITQDVVEYIKLLKSEKCELQGTADQSINYIEVLENY